MSRNDRKLRSKGLCVQCREPSPDRWRCRACTRKATETNRARRHAQTPPKRQCPLCLELGHLYKTCSLNPDAGAR